MTASLNPTTRTPECDNLAMCGAMVYSSIQQIKELKLPMGRYFVQLNDVESKTNYIYHECCRQSYPHTDSSLPKLM